MEELRSSEVANILRYYIFNRLIEADEGGAKKGYPSYILSPHGGGKGYQGYFTLSPLLSYPRRGGQDIPAGGGIVVVAHGLQPHAPSLQWIVATAQDTIK